MPGGFGTMDEFFEILTLVQTKTVTGFPIVLVGTEYYKPLLAMVDKMVEAGTIHKDDLQLLLVTDSVSDAMEHIGNYVRSNYRIRPRKRFWWLFEKR